MLETRFLVGDSLCNERGPRLLRWLVGHGAEEFSVTVMALQNTQAPIADAFEDALAPFELAAARRRVLASNAVAGLRPLVRRWRFSRESLPLLLRFFPHGLLHLAAGPDGWLEDLAVYRDGELVFGLVSPEKEGVLRLTRDEHAAVAALDIPVEKTAEWITY